MTTVVASEIIYSTQQQHHKKILCHQVLCLESGTEMKIIQPETMMFLILYVGDQEAP